MKINNTLKKFLLFFIAPLLTVTLITACGSDSDGPVDPPTEPELNLVELAQSDSNFSILVEKIVELELEGTLAQGNYTVFAPTNAAFNALPDGVLDNLTQDQLLDIITFHVTEGSIPSSALQAQQDVEMLNEEKTLVQSSAAGVLVNGSSNVVDADLEATNGFIHAVNEVLLPRDIRIALGVPNLVDVAEEAGSFGTLIGLIEDVGLTTTLQYLGPYTAFAPTDDAFAALFEQVDAGSLSPEQITFILTYHVIGGPGISSGDLEPQQAVPSAAEELLYITSDNEGVRVNGNASVIDADVEASNGIIHVVDNVLLPNAFLNTVQVAQKNYNFTTLVDLIVQADLAETVASNEFTVFAPTNDAFDALFAEVDPASLSDAQVEEILLYHTIPGASITSGVLQAQQTVESTSEEDLYITVNGEVVVNGNSTVVTADVASNNGIIHAVDTVLLPNAFVDVTAIAQKNYNLTSLVGLLVDFDLVETLQSDGPFTVFAPTNDAFDAISEVVGELSNDQITEVLTYHVLAANVESGDLAPTQTVEMLNEQEITITVDNGVVTITDAAGGTAEVVVADQIGTNGVVHIIDAVLIPNLEGDNGNGATEPANAAPAPTEDEANVISLFSEEYTDVTVNTWRTDWSSADYEEVTINGNPTKKYTNLDFVGIETTGDNLIDVSGMDYFHVDVWTPNMDVIRVKLVDFGPDGEFNGGDDSEHEIVFENLAQGEWHSLKIPLEDFEGLENFTSMAQYIFSGIPVGEGTLYIDNMYFSAD